MKKRKNRQVALPVGFPTAEVMREERRTFNQLLRRLNQKWETGLRSGLSRDQLEQEIARELGIEPHFAELFVVG